MYKLTLKDNIISYLEDPPTSSFEQRPVDLIVLWEQLVYSVVERINMSAFLFYFLEFSFLLQNPHSAPLSAPIGEGLSQKSQRHTTAWL